MFSSIEMQRIPKHGPNQVYKTQKDVKRGQQAAQKVKLPPQTFVLRPAPVPPSPEEVARRRAFERAQQASDRIILRRIRIARGILYILIALNNAVIIALVLASLVAGSGNTFQALAQIPSWLALIVISFYLYHRYRHRMFSMIMVRNWYTYTALWILALGSATIFTVRIQNGVMCRDFSAIEPLSCRIPQFLVSISWTTMFLALSGYLGVYFYQLAEPPAQVPIVLDKRSYLVGSPSSQSFSKDIESSWKPAEPPLSKVDREDRREWVEVPLYA